jgi:alkylated DNA repair dioxygenase AlkB
VSATEQLISLEDGGELLFIERWLPEAEARRCFTALMREIPWQQKTIVMMGKRVMQPRLVAWFGDPEAEYTYSGVLNEPLPWTPILAELRDRAGESAAHRFNSVLANLYRDGRDSMGFHADQEKELGTDPVIASLSLGAARRFQLRYTGKRKGVAGRDLELTDGSLLLMRGTTQHFWRHGVPKESRPVGPRVNLTFRQIFPALAASRR